MTNYENVVKLLQNRSYGGVKSRTCSRQTKVALDLSILKHLVSNKSKREYTEITRISTQGLVHYSNGKLFVKNSVTKKIDCYSVINDVHIIRKLWSIPAIPRWEDQAIIRDPEYTDYQNPQL
ncbi:uncharacterized protein LOC111716047, partial [Eurytemora carolleeae]|uniref:uncharacterized protein LOC111716047 n=1 Tax=Eurytemora carolleeae TaxID=1294199 RepID=UPI000C7629A5